MYGVGDSGPNALATPPIDDRRLVPRLQWAHPLPWNDLLGQAEGRIRDELEVTFRDERTPLSSRIRRRAEDFAKRWDVPDRAVRNFLELAHGNRSYPVILMQNPTDSAEDTEFWKMVENSQALSWVEAAVNNMWLLFSEVVIIDVCPLLSDSRLKIIENRERARLNTENEPRFVSMDRMKAINEAYELTREVLRELKPKFILSCQCATINMKWDTGDALMSLFCSSIKDAQKRSVTSTSLNGRNIHVIKAYHPSHIAYTRRDRTEMHADELNTQLQNIFIRTFHSCGTRKAQVRLLERIDAYLTDVEKYSRPRVSLEMARACVSDVSRLLSKEMGFFPDAERFVQDRIAFQATWTDFSSRMQPVSASVRRTVSQLLSEVWGDLHRIRNVQDLKYEIMP